MARQEQEKTKFMPKLVLAFLGLLIVFGTVLNPGTGKPYPDCNDNRARQNLIPLYDKQRLLHAVSASTGKLVRDSLIRRRCTVTVTWSDDTKTDVSYEFYYAGKQQVLQLWIDFNGGMHGYLAPYQLQNG